MTKSKGVLPDPEPGLVISYSYLWRAERESGREEVHKNRPCVIVLSVEIQGSVKQVTVAPITHSTPSADTASVELPLRVKQHLGLDDARSWVDLEEVNQFIWPGHDLRRIAQRKNQFSYGFVPPRLFDQIKNGILKTILIQRGAVTFRD